MLRIFAFSVMLLLVLRTNLHAESRKRLFVDITNPYVKKLPIAIADFKNMGEKHDRRGISEIRKTIEFDLNASGIFRLIQPEAFLKKEVNIQQFNSDDWKILGTAGVISTHYKISGSSIALEFRLFDVPTGKLVVGKRYRGDESDGRVMGHKFANEIMNYYTGESGVFTSKIAFVSNKTGNKEIYIMDWDAKNIRQITHNGSINLAPAWSPDKRYLVYTSFRMGNPDIWVTDLEKMTHRKVTRQKGLNTGANWLPDNKHIVFAASTQKRNGDTDLYMLNIQTKRKIRLTGTRGIDISPVVSHDGKKISFVSGRSGQPHIFSMNISGGDLLRITYAGRYNAGPAWSPDGKKIAFAGWDKANFDIFMVNSDATNMERLTRFSKDNEEPHWSPDGRLIVFQSTRRSTPHKRKCDLYIINSNGLGEQILLKDFGKATSPSWSPRF